MKRTLFALTVILLLPIGALASVALVGGLLSIVALLSPIILLGCTLICANEIAKAILDPSKDKQANNDENSTMQYGIKYFALATFAFLALLAPIAAAGVVIAALVSALALPILTVVIPLKITAKLFAKWAPKIDDELSSKFKTITVEELNLVDETTSHQDRNPNQDPSQHSAPRRFFAGVQEIVNKIGEVAPSDTNKTRP